MSSPIDPGPGPSGYRGPGRKILLLLFIPLLGLIMVAPWLPRALSFAVQLGLYLGFLGFVVYRLRVCFLRVSSPAQKQKVLFVGLWVGLFALGWFARLGKSDQADFHLYYDYLTDFGPLLAIQALTELVDSILDRKATAPTGRASGPEKVEPAAWPTS